MLLLEDATRRSQAQNLALGGTTAIVAGMVNVCSVMAFFAFGANVTGHVAILTEELSKGHWHQVSVVFAWLLAFLSGAIVANALIGVVGARSRAVGHALPAVLQIGLLLAVGYYCQTHYAETLRETEHLIGVLLFCMGLQNSTVATVSGSVVKTTHLTGLFTDLGMEISMFLRSRGASDPELRFKLVLHSTILAGYLLGGLVGGFGYLYYRYAALYLAAAVLSAVVVHDLALLWKAKWEDHASLRSARDTRAQASASWHAE